MFIMTIKKFLKLLLLLILLLILLLLYYHYYCERHVNIMLLFLLCVVLYVPINL